MTKKWIGRKPSTAMEFEALDREYQEDFRSKHHRTGLGQEAYDFNIKIQKINIPELVRHVYKENQIQSMADAKIHDVLVTFIEDMKWTYDWITEVLQEGRSGGWLVVVTNEPAFVDGIRLGYARKRIRELRQIEDLVVWSKKQLVKDLEDLDWWEVGPRDWSPRWKNR